MSEDTDTLNSQIDPALVEQAMALIKSSQRIALLAHESPDGDCIGSALGMAHILRQLGKDCVPACADAAPQNLSFLPGIEMLQQSLSDEFFDLVIALDAGELRRFGRLYEDHKHFLDSAQILSTMLAYRCDYRHEFLSIHKYNSSHVRGSSDVATRWSYTRNSSSTYIPYASIGTSAISSNDSRTCPDLLWREVDLVAGYWRNTYSCRCDSRDG